MDKTSSKPTRMSTTIHLEKYENRKDFDEKLYRSMIGSLLYLMAS